MRPPRMAILALFFTASFFLFCRSISALRRVPSAESTATSQKSSLRPFFSFAAPFTLFPPNADISLTDDNSTSFPARPAAFGPSLPVRGLSGQLWIGSGFTDDSLQDGEGEGELGCSDVPGWQVGRHQTIKTSDKAKLSDKSGVSGKPRKNTRRTDDLYKGTGGDRKVALPDESPEPSDKHTNDGTDDYLHEGLTKSNTSPDSSGVSGTNHADIQSIQEAAEITGKVVLLSRGGCGFLEKVKWAQRRGAVALIVGDNQKGGPLIQMFARGDVSNVTIPSIFTSRTTAHLLSSLMQPGSFIEDIVDGKGHAMLKVQQADKTRKAKNTATTAVAKATAEAKAIKDASDKERTSPSENDSNAGGWFYRLFHWGTSVSTPQHSRISNSGQLDWVLVDDWSDEKDKDIRSGLNKASKGKGGTITADTVQTKAEDGFQIGVQDWRDPDLVETIVKKPEGSDKSSGRDTGSSTNAADRRSRNGNVAGGNSGPQGDAAKSFNDGGDEDEAGEFTSSRSASGAGGKDAPEHEGLWVTITPAGNANPFFDTLLVLVISPLVTLTLVYALLILRAKIRRRRWRAPKSVVEQLPVRTYHTVATTPSHTPRMPSPTSSSPTTPLLQGSSRPRPRSRTTTGIPDSADLLRADAALQSSLSPPRAENREKGTGNMSSEWKKYMGRQVECVVCLEEYVDGVSRVMSLPCGHEFHVDCITPWLTTRRRTCPICKGDVVRSLARGSPSSPRYEPYRDDSDDELDMPALGQRSPSPEHRDVEQGITIMPAPPSARRRRDQANSEGWLHTISNSLTSLGAGFSQSRPSQPGSDSDHDRDR